MKTDSVSNSFRWVILLLAAAVILPTVCLLWFMNQAVKNERLAVRQKLTDICNENIENLKADLVETMVADYTPPIVLENKEKEIPGWINAIKRDADSVVIYDDDGQLIYPIRMVETVPEYSESIQAVYALEQQGQYEKAFALYAQAAEPNQPEDDFFAACMGQIRCLDELSRIADILDLFHKLLRSQDNAWRKKLTPQQVAMLRVKKIELLAKYKDTYSSGDMFLPLAGWYTPWEKYPSETTIWALKKILAIAAEYRDEWKLDDSIERAQTIIATESLALRWADFFDQYPETIQHPAGRWFAVKERPDYYIMADHTETHTLFYIRSKQRWQASVEDLLDAFPLSGTKLILHDNLNRIVYGSPAPSIVEPFLVYELDGLSDGWRLDLHLDNDDPFTAAAQQQTTIYLWTGILVTVFILFVGTVAIRSVNHQIKINRLKNDFIATVTHELKTPLASMRVLVDTLLEGNYEGEKTATEYLQLVATENKRLTHLIDSFLTFSRMERNKQVFDFQSISPAEIANAAVEAMGTKFCNGGCHCDFACTVADDLPMINADKDGMVTVLVNLLDNAYKYTNSDKQIELKVYEQNGTVCFAVKDNGIGLSPRALKRIFNRFYQVDSRLSRQAEGCGLGLSIVKFIVDAHKGTIEVESKIEEGSTFTVKLQIR